MKDLKLIREKDKLRGMVPASDDGRHDHVYEAYLKKIDVENNVDIQRQLAASPDPRFRQFLDRMAIPGRHLKIQTVAKQCGIDLMEFGDWFSKAATQIAIGNAQLHAAGIVQDMAGDAATKQEYCERCDGLGWIAAPNNLPVDTLGYRIMGMDENEKPIWCRTCPKCKGKANVAVVGDEHSRDKILEIAGLVQKGKGGGVQIVQNFGGAAHTSAVSGALSALTIDVDAE